MSNTYQCLRGMRDLTPYESERMSFIEQTMQSIVKQYGYQEIRFPILESTQLFEKSIGIETDIIGQEMYTFTDRNDTPVAMRPEGTAGCLRSCLANGLIQREKQKLYYHGPMFRRERPQKGRFRQFQHFGVETFGYPSGLIDVEMIAMTQKMWQALNLSNINLLVNYLGSPETRQQYREVLQQYWQSNLNLLTEAEQKRAQENPLRLLDSKNPSLQELIQDAPALTQYLSDTEQKTYRRILDTLKQLDIPYTESNQLVRGLDYYSDFIFEWVSPELGSQSTICGGGRYDPLVKQMGGDTPATGFAAGIDRIETLLPVKTDNPQKILICTDNEESLFSTYPILNQLPHHQSTIINIDTVAGKINNKIKQAKRLEFDYLIAIEQDNPTLRILTLNNQQPTLEIQPTELIQWFTQLTGSTS